MIIKLLCFVKNNFLKLTFLCFVLLSSTSYSQCAGNDNSITICGADLPDPSSQSVDLFTLLGVDAVPGGIWTDNNLSGGLNTSTGNLNAQLIKRSGVFTYTYTSNAGCADNTSIITVTIGGYSGVSSPDVSACDDDQAFNLFQGFNGQTLGPQINGFWSDDDVTSALNGNTFDASLVTPGTYSFTYTMPVIGSCPAQSSTVNVTVFRAPEPGTPQMMLLCSSDDLSLLQNLDLHTRLAGEDSGGMWSESGTSELSGPLDSTINVKNIYDTFGAGEYRFTYSVFPDNPICTIKRAVVSIIIEQQLDFTGANFVVNSDICENEIFTANYNAVLTKGIADIPNGSYDVDYFISGPSGITTRNVTASFNGGVLTFPIPSNNFQEVADYTIKITDIESVSSLGACTTIIDVSDVLHVYPLPKINSATLTIDPVCKDNDAVVDFSGISNLTDGDYDIVYNLSGSNIATSQSATFTVTSGLATFTIPASLIPIVGNTTITITNITNLTTGCTNSSTLSQAFVIKPLNSLSALAVDISDVCEDQLVTVTISGLTTLTDITLNYKLTGANTTSDQITSMPVISSKVSFIISSSFLSNTGITTFEINDIIDNSGGCNTVITNGTKSFTIYTFPSNPIVNDQDFCKNDNATIASLLPSGSQYQWFDSVTSTTALASSTPLVSGSYYVKEVNAVTGCESGLEEVVVAIDEVQTPVLSLEGQNFCGLDNPTLQSLSDKVTSNGSLTWFDAATDGNQLFSTEALVDGKTYYGYDFSSSTNCYSNVLEVTVSLLNCDETASFFIPDGFSPNGDNVNDTFGIPDIEFIYPNYALEIYNRYGSLMFKGNKNKPLWDGKSSDSKVSIGGYAPNGVYFYIINYNKGNKSPKQGRLYLNR